MKKIFLLIILITTSIVAQERYAISGIVKDARNGETLFGASVYLKATSIGVLTNEYGFYSISEPKGTYTLVISYLGYDTVINDIEL